MRRDAVEVHQLIQPQPQSHREPRTDLVDRAVAELFYKIIECHAPLGHAVYEICEQCAVALVTRNAVQRGTERQRDVFILLLGIPQDGERGFTNIHLSTIVSAIH